MKVRERIRIEYFYYSFTYNYILSLYSYTNKLQLASAVKTYKKFPVGRKHNNISNNKKDKRLLTKRITRK